MKLMFYPAPLTYAELDDWMIQLVRPFGFVSSRGEVVLVPPGRTSNMASIPWLIRWLLRRNGSYGDAAVIHDEITDEGRNYLPDYRHRVFDWQEPAVASLVAGMPWMSNETFIKAWTAAWRYTISISWQDSVRIMDEAMRCPPRPTAAPIRKIITTAIRIGGPRWK